MDEIVEHAWFISIVGDFLTLFGAYWTARAVILTKQQADAISSRTVWRSTTRCTQLPFWLRARQPGPDWCV